LPDVETLMQARWKLGYITEMSYILAYLMPFLFIAGPYRLSMP
jgi:hypothetical protein